MQEQTSIEIRHVDPWSLFWVAFLLFGVGTTVGLAPTFLEGVMEDGSVSFFGIYSYVMTVGIVTFILATASGVSAVVYNWFVEKYAGIQLEIRAE